MINQFRERNFILSRYGPHLYGFVHRTFLEYFCAEAIVGKFKHDQRWPFDRLRELFEQHWADPSWREVLRLVAGALHERHSAQLIELLTTDVNQPWPPGEFAQPPWNLALAVQCLAEVRNPHSEVAKPAETLLRQRRPAAGALRVDQRPRHDGADRGGDPAGGAGDRHELARAGDAYLTWYRRRGVRLIWSSVSADAARLAAVLAAAVGARGGPLRRRARRDRRPAGGVRVGGRSGRAGAGRGHRRQPVRLPARPGQGPRPARSPGPATTATPAYGWPRSRRSASASAPTCVVRDVLIERARGDGYAAVRLAAVRALGARFRAGRPSREPAARPAPGGDGNPSVRRAAVQTMERLLARRRPARGAGRPGAHRPRRRGGRRWPPGRCTTAAATSRCATR